MPPEKSPIQMEANRQTLLLIQEINQYQYLMDAGRSLQNIPSIHRPIPNLYIKNLDDWVISRQTLDGDFDLDELLARELATRVVNNLLDAEWLKDYLNYQPGEEAGFGGVFKDAIFGSSNISGNLNQARGGLEAFMSSHKFQEAEKKIKSGKFNGVRLNENMTLYNADKSGKGSPRLRLRVRGLDVKVITPLLDPQMLKTNPQAVRIYKRGGFSVRADVIKNQGGLSGITGRSAMLNTRMAGGILTFAPSTAIDLYRNFNDGQLDGRQFVIDQAKHQSGNLVGWGVGTAIGIAGAAVGAPVVGTIVVVFILGIGVQALWNYSGMADNVGRLAEKQIGR
ncbi:MAG: hypothetical protein WAP08_08500 [Smithellaceae bacterium]|nr:hypothetical protein [Smithella sp.]OQC03146.1 MAG: hypothetical protein BWX77_00819 [Bacteroidetes bacterium ADurb.Bin090]HPL97967.1 hypothetical protein [Smithellaceae bacterium]